MVDATKQKETSQMSIARTTYVSTAEREDLMTKPVTLNGRPAIISGRLSPFAVVRTNDGDRGYVGEWSWHSVRHVIENNAGAFKL
jgi:hypothetical protein